MDTLNKDLKTFHKLHPNRKLAVFAIFVFVFIVSVVVGRMFTNGGELGENPLAPKAGDETALAKPSLSLRTDSETIQVGKPFVVTVSLNDVPVQATDIWLNYDTEMFSVKTADIKQGTAFKEMTEDPSVSEEDGKGVLKYSTNVGLGSLTELGSGDVFSFTMKPLKKGASTISFEVDGSKRTNAAKGGTDILGKADPITITVK